MRPCPDKYGAPCGKPGCPQCNQGIDDVRDDLALMTEERDELRAEVDRLRQIEAAARAWCGICGKGFRNLDHAILAISGVLAGTLHVTGDHCTRGTRRVLEVLL